MKPMIFVLGSKHLNGIGGVFMKNKLQKYLFPKY